ncbi:MAG: DUF1416 domain-containing protein, partial [Planctomycetota bacterium]
MKPVILLALLLALLVSAWRLTGDAQRQGAISAPDRAPTQEGVADAGLEAGPIRAQHAVRADVSELPSDVAFIADAADPAPSTEPLRYVLHALCLDETGAALAGVDVEVVSLRGHPRTVSEADGRVTLVLEDPVSVGWPLPQVPGNPLQPRVRFQLRGHAVRVVQADLRGRRDVDLGVAVLPLAGEIEGRVLGDDGLPLSGVRVGAMFPRPPNLTAAERDTLRATGPLWALSYQPAAGLAQTGIDGRFRLRGLSPGATSVVAAGSGTFTTWSQQVEVRAGESASVGDLILETGPAQERIAGRVLDPAGRGASGALVSISPIHIGHRSPEGLAVCAADGSFSLAALTGQKYDVEARLQERRARVDEVLPGTLDLRLVLEPPSLDPAPRDDGTRLRGRVTADGRPVVGTLVRVADERGRVQAEVRSDAQGRFTLAPTGGGLWRVSAHSEAGGNHRLGEAGPLQIDPGEEVQGIQLVLVLPGALVGQIRVAAGDSRAGYRVLATRPGRQRSSSTGLDGTWGIEALLPGTWEVAVLPPGNESNQDRARQEANTMLEIAAGDTQRWDVDLAGAWPCRLSGYLRFGGRATGGWVLSMDSVRSDLGPGGAFERQFEAAGPQQWVALGPRGGGAFTYVLRTVELLSGENR